MALTIHIDMAIIYNPWWSEFGHATTSPSIQTGSRSRLIWFIQSTIWRSWGGVCIQSLSSCKNMCMLCPIHEIAHFMKYAIVLPISGNMQLTCLFHEMGKTSAAHAWVSKLSVDFGNSYKIFNLALKPLEPALLIYFMLCDSQESSIVLFSLVFLDGIYWNSH